MVDQSTGQRSVKQNQGGQDPHGNFNVTEKKGILLKSSSHILITPYVSWVIWMWQSSGIGLLLSLSALLCWLQQPSSSG